MKAFVYKMAKDAIKKVLEQGNFGVGTNAISCVYYNGRRPSNLKGCSCVVGWMMRNMGYTNLPVLARLKRTARGLVNTGEVSKYMPNLPAGVHLDHTDAEFLQAVQMVHDQASAPNIYRPNSRLVAELLLTAVATHAQDVVDVYSEAIFEAAFEGLFDTATDTN